MFLNVCKQTFHLSHVRISQKVTGVLMWNLQHISGPSTIKALERRFDVVLVSLLLKMSRFQTFRCFQCWLQSGKCAVDTSKYEIKIWSKCCCKFFFQWYIVESHVILTQYQLVKGSDMICNFLSTFSCGRFYS